MDGTLLRISGRRPVRLLKSDLPEVAVAIVAYARGKVRVDANQGRGISYVRLHGLTVNVVIRHEDWEKILPYVETDTFHPQIVPAATPTVRDPEVHFAPGTLDARDRTFYARVLGILQSLFTDDYPTSSL